MISGRRLGEFVVREQLSAGGFGEVYRAEQPGLDREAVIKVLHAKLRKSERVVERFLREAKLASRLDHPYAAHIYAFGVETDGLMWIAMELVRGTPLDKLLAASGPIALERFAPLLERICQVVATAHEQGIVHRDLKPANVMVLVRAGQLLPKLLDLGIAKLDEEPARKIEPADDIDGFAETDGRLTEEGSVMGSPLYMAPEQWLDASTADARTDLYALGVLSYEALTGVPPFRGDSRLAICEAHARKPVPRLGGKLPAALDDVLAKALAKKAGERYAGALELAAAFRSASGLADEPVGLPKLDDGVRIHALARLPQPLAQAVALVDGARNAHQARDAVWMFVRVAARLIGCVALAAHSHVGDSQQNLVALRQKSLSDGEWLALARSLGAPFREVRAAYPLPELLDLLDHPALDRLVELRDAALPVDAVLAAAIPLVEQLLGALELLGAYQLAVPTDREVEVWAGVGRGEPTAIAHAKLVPWQPAILDPNGYPVVVLWPFVQAHEPSPGVHARLFFLEGKGRRGARLIALPEAFEHEDEALWDAFGDDGAISDEEVCPYPGLSAFTAADAGRFFGRERETEALVNRLRAQALIAVVGPSGAGKSSFVQAGVLPALPPAWTTVVMRPGATPLARLDKAFVRGDGVTVLVVDQLEELFTLCEDPYERTVFSERLYGFLKDENVRVILTLRDDFLMSAGALPAFRTRLATSLFLVTAPAPDDLQRILVEPLRRAGYELDDPALAKEVVDALADTRSPLALLSFTGQQLWAKRDRRFRQLSRKAYASLGGVGGALAQHAEQMFAAMVDEEQRLVREVFRHAVTAEGTRAVLARHELDQVLGGGAHAAAVIDKLLDARLFAAQDDNVELTHEALIDAWPRLVAWRREDAEGARLRDQLRSAARQWDERGRSPGLLWRGDALVEYRLWRARFPGQLAELETAFADASLVDATRTSRRRRTTLAIAFTVLAAGVLALLLLNRRVATQSAQLENNLASQYEAQGRRLVVDGDAAQGLAYLAKAAEAGAGGKAHDLLVAFAARTLASEERWFRHADRLSAAAWSPDGALVAFGGFDNRTTLWNIAEGRRLAELPAGDQVLRLAFSADGKRLAIGDASGGLAIATDGVQQTLGKGAAIQGLAFAGDRLLAIRADDTVELWDNGARRVLQRDAHPPPPILSGTPGAFSADGRRVAVGDSTGVVRIWDVASGAAIATTKAHADQINTLAFSPDGARVLTASNDRTAALVDATTGAVQHVLHHADRVNTARFSPDGKRVATASNDRSSKLWSVETGALEHTFEGHESGVNAAEFRADGAQLATIGDDGLAQLWQLPDFHRDARLVGHAGAINALVYAPHGDRIATAGEDGLAIVWRTTAQSPARELRGHTGMVADADVCGAHVVSVGVDRTIRLWDRASGRVLHQWPSAEPGRTRFSPDCTRIAANDEQVVHILNVADGKDAPVLAGHERAIYDVAWSPTGTRIATGSLDGTARSWPLDGSAPTIFRDHHQAVGSVSFGADGTSIVSVGADREMRVWDARTGAAGSHFANEHASSATFAPTGARLLVTTTRGSAQVFDAGGTLVAEMLGHRGNVYTATWSPDGAFALTSSIDGTARIWNATNGELLAVFATEDHAQLYSASYAPDGREIVTAGGNGVVTLWELPDRPTDLALLLRCRVPYRFEGDRIVHVQIPDVCTSRTP